MRKIKTSPLPAPAGPEGRGWCYYVFFMMELWIFLASFVCTILMLPWACLFVAPLPRNAWVYYRARPCRTALFGGGVMYNIGLWFWKSFNFVFLLFSSLLFSWSSCILLCCLFFQKKLNWKLFLNGVGFIWFLVLLDFPGKSLWLARQADRALHKKRMWYDLQTIPGFVYDRIYTNFAFSGCLMFSIGFSR